MKLLCVVVTHNRRAYTERCLASLRAHGDENFKIVVVDNASTDGTQQLADIRNTKNLYPGAACNIGWHHGLQTFDADLLMRSDNDIEYLDGWREEVEDKFTNLWELGLFGLHNRHEDYDGHPPVTDHKGVNVQWGNVGGNCVMRRQLWDAGLRWNPGAWAPGGQDEDTRMSHEVKKHGLIIGCAIPVLCNNMSFHRYEDYPEYYDRTAAVRGLVPELSV